ncbi:MAG: phospholipase D-like domain-containing protein [Jatrophihabitans sp.]|uniref:phospholipase D-like domain-containing protein n=1 Tax=Jatrophihabitans sp. TaxID=1932789 RepID=UPI00390D72C2
MFVQAKGNGLHVKAHRGDAKSLLAFNLTKARTRNLAGFTVAYVVGAQTHYVSNMLTFANPADHSQDPAHAANSSVNAPLHKFRWVHVPGAGSLGEKPAFGPYTYVVTPRYFADGALLPLDPSTSVSVDIEVAPFRKGAITAAFTRGFTQSEAFVHRFGEVAIFRPPNTDLVFDTSATSGTAANGAAYTFAQEYTWLGFTARDVILGLLSEIRYDATLQLDVFAYDLSEPDIVSALLALGADGRVRMILDDAALHHSTKPGTVLPEDQFETLFRAAAKAPAEIKRGHFARYSHDKVMIVYRTGAGGARRPIKVLTGSTNFSVTGLYVNSNHVLVFDDTTVAAAYARVFQNSWDGEVKAPAFRATPEAGQATTFASAQVPHTDVTFSPHSAAFAAEILDGITARITAEAGRPKGSVLFAVMGIDVGGGSVYPTLRDLHADTSLFTYGISDAPDGIYVYNPRHKTGVLVTGKPGRTRLPAPFDQVPTPANHQVHHKFVVCGFNGSDPVVYCGSSNLALGGEQDNGDNLLAIHDGDIATVFAIEAVLLVDHFDFLDRNLAPAATSPATATWHLSITSAWVTPYYDKADLHYADRLLFA